MYRILISKFGVINKLKPTIKQMKNLLLTFIVLLLSFTTKASENPSRVMYEDDQVSITAEVIECGDMVYTNFTYTNKTNTTVTITYQLEIKYAGSLKYITDDEKGTITVIVHPNGTIKGVCGSYDYMLFLGSKSDRMHILDYKLTNVKITN